MAPSAALWKLSMDPLIGGVGSPQLPEMEYDHKFHNVLVLLHDVNKHEDDFHCD